MGGGSCQLSGGHSSVEELVALVRGPGFDSQASDCNAGFLFQIPLNVLITVQLYVMDKQCCHIACEGAPSLVAAVSITRDIM